MRTKAIRALFSLGVLLVAAQFAMAGSKVAICGIDESEATGEAAERGRKLIDLAFVELANEAGVELIERQAVQKVLDELGLRIDGLADSAAAARVGKMLGADKLVLGAHFKSASKADMVAIKIVRSESSVIDEFAILPLAESSLQNSAKQMANIVKRSSLEGRKNEAVLLGVGRFIQAGLADYNIDVKGQISAYLMERYAGRPGIALVERSDMDSLIQEKQLIRRGFIVSDATNAISGVASIFISGSYETVRKEKTLLELKLNVSAAGKWPYSKTLIGETAEEVFEKVGKDLDAYIATLGSGVSGGDRKAEIAAQWDRIYEALSKPDQYGRSLERRYSVVGPYNRQGELDVKFFVDPMDNIKIRASADQERALAEGFAAIALLSEGDAEIWEVVVETLKRYGRHTSAEQREESNGRLKEMARNCDDPRARYFAGVALWCEDEVRLPEELREKYQGFDARWNLAILRQLPGRGWLIRREGIATHQEYCDRYQKIVTELCRRLVDGKGNEKDPDRLLQIVGRVFDLTFNGTSPEDAPFNQKLRTNLLKAVPQTMPYFLFNSCSSDDDYDRSVMREQIKFLKSMKTKKADLFNPTLLLKMLYVDSDLSRVVWDAEFKNEYEQKYKAGMHGRCIDLALKSMEYRLEKYPVHKYGEYPPGVKLSDIADEEEEEKLDGREAAEIENSGKVSPETVNRILGHVEQFQTRGAAVPDIKKELNEVAEIFKNSKQQRDTTVANQAFIAYAELWWWYNWNAKCGFSSGRPPERREFYPELTAYVLVEKCFGRKNPRMPVSEFITRNRMDLWEIMHEAKTNKERIWDKPRFCRLFGECIRSKSGIYPVMKKISGRVDELLGTEQYEQCFDVLSEAAAMMVGDGSIPEYARDRLQGGSPDEICDLVVSSADDVFAGICSDLNGGVFVISASGKAGHAKAGSSKVDYYDIDEEILRPGPAWAYEIAASKDKVWIRSFNGVCEIDRKTGVAKRYGKEEGILVPYIAAMCASSDGKRVWLSMSEKFRPDYGLYGEVFNGYIDTEKGSFVGCSDLKSRTRIAAGTRGVLWYSGDDHDSSYFGMYSPYSNQSRDVRYNPHSQKAAESLMHDTHGSMHSIASSGQLVLMDAEYGLLAYDSFNDAYSTIDIFPAKTVQASREAVRRISVHGCGGVVSWEKRAWIVDIEKKVQLAQIESAARITDVDACRDGVWLAVEGKGIYFLGSGKLGSDALSRMPSTENAVKPIKVMIVPFEDEAATTVKGVGVKVSDKIAAIMSNNDTNLNYWLNEPAFDVMERGQVEKIINDAGITPTYRGTISAKVLAPLTDADFYVHGRAGVDDKGIYKVQYSLAGLRSKLSAGGSGAMPSNDIDVQAKGVVSSVLMSIRQYTSSPSAEQEPEKAPKSPPAKEAGATSKPKEAQEEKVDPDSVIKVRALIDGTDILKLKGRQLWYEHQDASLPGKWAGRNEPTFVNDERWLPEWQGNKSTIFRIPGHVPRRIEGKDITLKKIKARGKLSILEQPSAKNDQTLSVYLQDPDTGADWFIFDLVFEEVGQEQQKK